jgi:AcrR family transcriptional regulator
VATITVPRRRGRFAGLSLDERKTERRRLLLDAAYELLATEGWSATTVRAVCHRSGLNPRYFYESFADRDALAVAVFERLVGELRSSVVAAMDAAPADFPSQMRAGVECTVSFVSDDRRRARVLYVESVGIDALDRRRIDTGHELTAFIVEDARRRQRAAADDDPTTALTAAVLVGGMSEVMLAWIEGRIEIGREQLVEDLTAMFVALCEGAGRVAVERRRGVGTVSRS